MKSKFIIVVLTAVFVYPAFPQEERKVLVELFTNSHCSLCPDAHNTLDNYVNSSGNGDKLSFIYYHMEYPYPDDLLYQHNPEDSDGRHEYYQPFPATPRAFFNGEIQGSITAWNSKLDQLTTEESPLKIILSGSAAGNSINIAASVSRIGNIADNDLVIHFVVVENVYYAGRNGILIHKDVMRKMAASPTGEPFSVILNETKVVEKEINLNPVWIPDSLKVVVFIQSDSSMNVYQSEFISYNELTTTSTGNEISTPSQYILEQNYPNPFNPSTKIKYSLPEENFVTLNVYNILGAEISNLVAEKQQAGNYEFSFIADGLTSGIYFYRLTAVNSENEKTVLTKKMTLIK
jgi:hypothetical protein